MGFIGVDYGAKLAGTTALSFLQDGLITSLQTVKNQDADSFLQEQIAALKPKIVFIDAPLSLPGVYTHPHTFKDFFYRLCDKELAAMSPMFLGGLTARAMQLKSKFPDVVFQETYPAHKIKLLGLKNLGYKSDKQNIKELIFILQKQYNLNFEADTYQSWHAFDSLLAYLSGVDHQQRKAQIYGDITEGQIIV